MSPFKSKKAAFRPSPVAALEERVVMNGATVVIGGPTPVAYRSGGAFSNSTSTPALPPSTPGLSIGGTGYPVTVHNLKLAYARQVRLAATDLRSYVSQQTALLYANGAKPTAQQISDFNARVAGAVNATALRLSSQVALLPGGSQKLVPGIQNALLGSSGRALATKLETIALSGRFGTSASALTSALSRQINSATQQNIGRINGFLSLPGLARSSVDATTGQRIPIQQFMANQIVGQLSNSLGLISQNFGSVANAMLFPNGTTATPSAAAMSAFNTQVANALGTAAFQLGSSLSLLNGSNTVATQLQPLLFGASSGLNGGTNTSLPPTTSLFGALQGLQYGGTNFNTSLGSAFNTGFQNLSTPLNSFLGLTGGQNVSLPQSNLNNPFVNLFSGSSFNGGFNNGFLSGTTGTGSSPSVGFPGFGMAPTSGFNSNFGQGFNSFIGTLNQNLGFLPPTTNLFGGTNIGTGTSTGTNSGTSTGTNSGTTM